MHITGEKGQVPLRFDPLRRLHPRQRHGNLAWVPTTHEPVIFGELFHPSQFCLTNGPADDERRITLLDLDCRQMPANYVNMASARERLAQLQQSFDNPAT